MTRMAPYAVAAALASLSLSACDGGRRGGSASPGPPRDAAPVVLITIDTLRPDHMSAYGYARNTTPAIARWAGGGTVFSQAYTYWPKTRGSFVAMMTGRTAGESGYSARHPALHDFNPTLAETLRKEGFATAAFVDNANVAASLGFGRGFERYVETWMDATLSTETSRTERITRGAEEFVASQRSGSPFFLWVHYVNPHTPYDPPPPFDASFAGAPKDERRLRVVDGPFGGIPRQFFHKDRDRLSQYVNAYDGEIAYVDTHVDRVMSALDLRGLLARATVILTSDHGESFGEHDYYFDHGANLFDPCQRVPFIAWGPGSRARKSDVLVSTLDVMPSLLDAARVSYPPGLAGRSILGFLGGRTESTRAELFGENDRGWTGAWDARHKVVRDDRGIERRFDRAEDPREERPRADLGVSAARLARALEGFVEVGGRSRARTRALLEGRAPSAMSKESCEQLRALGYIDECQ